MTIEVGDALSDTVVMDVCLARQYNFMHCSNKQNDKHNGEGNYMDITADELIRHWS